MNMRLSTVVLCGVGLAALGACSSDDTTGSGGSGGGTTTTTTTSGSAGSTTTSSSGGSGGATTSSGTAGSGGGACVSCASYITDCVAAPEPEAYCADIDGPDCTGSDALFQALADCVCTECATECENTCAGMEGDDPEVCSTCQQGATVGACSRDFGACANDI